MGMGVMSSSLKRMFIISFVSLFFGSNGFFVS